jgi:type I restriction enzyme S subunit
MKQGWEIKRLDDACEVEYGTRVVNKRDGGTIYPVYGGGGATFFMDIFNRENCFIVSRFAMSHQCTRFVDGKFFLNDSGLSVKAKNHKEILQDFLNLQILYLNDHIYSLARGTAQKNLDVPAFRNIEINYPKSIQEQQRIVSILDEAFTAIDKAKANAVQNLKNAKELFESYLQEVFENKGEGWEEKPLGELATFRNGMNFTKSSKGEKIKIVGVKDFQNSFWVPFEILETAVLDGKLNDVDLLKEGDILAVRSNGNPQLIGRTLLASEVVGKVSHSGFTIRIRLNTENLNPIYLCNFLKIPKTRKILVDGGNGVGIKSLNQGSLSSLLITFPKSIKEQQAIVKKLDALSLETKKLEGIYQKKIADLEELKKSVLQKAFAGELMEKLVTV